MSMPPLMAAGLTEELLVMRIAQEHPTWSYAEVFAEAGKYSPLENVGPWMIDFVQQTRESPNV